MHDFWALIAILGCQNFAQDFDNPILLLKPKILEFIAIRRHKGAFSDIFFNHSSNFVQTYQNSPFFAYFTQDFAQSMKKIAWAVLCWQIVQNFDNPILQLKPKIS